MSFKADIDAFIRKSEDLTLAVVKDAAKAVHDEAQTPVAKGGNMRVDTGFLRNSMVAALNQLPSGEDVNLGAVVGDYNPAPVLIVIESAKMGDKINMGWTANYARHRETHDGFARSAVMNWQRHVSNAVMKLKAAFK